MCLFCAVPAWRLVRPVGGLRPPGKFALFCACMAPVGWPRPPGAACFSKCARRRWGLLTSPTGWSCRPVPLRLRCRCLLIYCLGSKRKAFRHAGFITAEVALHAQLCL